MNESVWVFNMALSRFRIPLPNLTSAKLGFTHYNSGEVSLFTLPIVVSV